MTQKNNRTGLIALIAVATLGGGAIAAAVTHQVMSRRAVMTTETGERFEVELLDSVEGADGSFVTDDGKVFGINMISGAEHTPGVEQGEGEHSAELRPMNSFIRDGETHGAEAAPGLSGPNDWVQDSNADD